MGILPYGDDDRLLTGREEALVKKVYKHTRLPPFFKIRIRNGLSPNDTPITFPNYADGTYNISVGKLFEGDLTDTQYGRDTLVHKMTHVWQYYDRLLTMAHGIVAHTHRYFAGKFGYRDESYLYEYDILTDSWDDMGFEGQAQLVEEWYHDGMKGEDGDKRFCFVKRVLYDGDAGARKLNIVNLCEKDFYPPPGPDPEPVRVWAKDDSCVMILNGDVVFDFDKSDIKPGAISILNKAINNIKSLLRRGTVIRINGYTDNIGSDDYNNRLSGGARKPSPAGCPRKVWRRRRSKRVVSAKRIPLPRTTTRRGAQGTAASKFFLPIPNLRCAPAAAAPACPRPG